MRHSKPWNPARFQGFFVLASVQFTVGRLVSSKPTDGNPWAFGGVPMIVVMKPGSTPQQIDHIKERIEQLGLRSHIIVGTDRTVIAALGEKRDGAKQALETGEGVEKVVPILAPYKMASTEVKQERTVVSAQGLKVGGRHLGVIHARCSRDD